VDVITSTASTAARVKGFELNSGAFTTSLARMDPFGAVTVGAQVTALDINGDGRSELAVSIFQNSRVKVKLFNATGDQQASYNASVNTAAFGIGASDLDRDGKDELMIGVIPAPGMVAIAGNDQINILNPLTGAKTDGFNAFAVLVGGVALSGVN
jgi:hypothetical protein